jgi:hypothetical protein
MGAETQRKSFPPSTKVERVTLIDAYRQIDDFESC